MKKLFIILLVAVLLVAGGLGGIVYAQNGTHAPMTSQKLISTGIVGKVFEATDTHPGTVMVTMFSITNADCVAKTKLDRISVFEVDGTVIYEGPPMVGMTGDELTTPLESHQTVWVWLPWYVLGPTGPSDPSVWPGMEQYTIEIFWTGAKEAVPLIGWSWTVTETFVTSDGGGFEVTGMTTSSMTQMENMTQGKK